MQDRGRPRVWAVRLAVLAFLVIPVGERLWEGAPLPRALWGPIDCLWELMLSPLFWLVAVPVLIQGMTARALEWSLQVADTAIDRVETTVQLRIARKARRAAQGAAVVPAPAPHGRGDEPEGTSPPVTSPPAQTGGRCHQRGS